MNDFLNKWPNMSIQGAPLNVDVTIKNYFQDSKVYKK